MLISFIQNDAHYYLAMASKDYNASRLYLNLSHMLLTTYIVTTQKPHNNSKPDLTSHGLDEIPLAVPLTNAKESR